MKKLNKVLKTAAVEKVDKKVALQRFLKAYRETPHTTTKVAPALLMLGYSRSSGIPQFESPTSDRDRATRAHAAAMENDARAKERMKLDFDARMHTRECSLRVGMRVLAKLDKVNKTTPNWCPDPYVITHINGSQVTASRHDHVMVRNSSFFKEFPGQGRGNKVQEAPTVESKPCKLTHFSFDQAKLEPTSGNDVQKEGEVAATSTPKPAQVEEKRRVGRPSKGKAIPRTNDKQSANIPVRSSDRIKAKRQVQGKTQSRAISQSGGEML
jgi:hypothetical protein